MSRASLHFLPVEVVQEILTWLPLIGDLVSTSLVSKKLQSISTRQLYRSLCFRINDSSHKRIFRCLETLKSNEAARYSVRTVVVHSLPLLSPIIRPYDISAESAIAAVLGSLRNLQNLAISSTNKVFTNALADAALPKLTLLFYCPPLSNSLIRFFNRCPNIESLTLRTVTSDEFDKLDEKISLPFLQEYEGSPHVIKLLGYKAPLRRVCLYWAYLDSRGTKFFKDALDVLGEQLGSSVKDLIVYRVASHGVALSNLDLLVQISRALPDIQGLSLNALPRDENLVSRALTRFTRLASFDAAPHLRHSCAHCFQEHRANLGLPISFCRYDSDHETLTAWASGARTLEMCILPSGLVWTREPEQGLRHKLSTVWLPQIQQLPGEDRAIGEQWITKRLLEVVQGRPGKLKGLLQSPESDPEGRKMLADVWTPTGPEPIARKAMTWPKGEVDPYHTPTCRHRMVYGHL